MSQEAALLIASTELALRELGYKQIWQTKCLHFVSSQQAILESCVARIPGQVLRAQVFVGSTTRQCFLDQIRVHYKLAKVNPQCASLLYEVCVSPHVKLPILVFRDDFPLDLPRVCRALEPGFACAAKWRLALSLIQLATTCSQQSCSLQSLTVGKCRVANDESFRATMCNFFQATSPVSMSDLFLDDPNRLSLENLWALGLVLFEIFFDTTAESQLVRLLNGDLRVTSVRNLYLKYLHETDAFTSFAAFCFPNIRDESKPASAVHTVLCLCMKPQAVCDSLQRAAWTQEAFSILESIASDQASCPESAVPTKPACGWFTKVDQIAARRSQVPVPAEALALIELFLICGMQARALICQRVFELEAVVGVEPLHIVHILLSFWFPCAKERAGVAKVIGFDLECDFGPSLRNLNVLLACLSAV